MSVYDLETLLLKFIEKCTIEFVVVAVNFRSERPMFWLHTFKGRYSCLRSILCCFPIEQHWYKTRYNISFIISRARVLRERNVFLLVGIRTLGLQINIPFVHADDPWIWWIAIYSRYIEWMGISSDPQLPLGLPSDNIHRVLSSLRQAAASFCVCLKDTALRYTWRKSHRRISECSKRYIHMIIPIKYNVTATKTWSRWG